MQKYLDKISREYGNNSSLSRVKYVLGKWGYLKHDFKVIHVAGTNGKGSVCYKLAQTLSYNKQKVGLFTSPHFKRFTERIQVDFVEISYQKAFAIIEKIQKIDQDESLGICYFDCMCILAFVYFTQEKISVAVIEAGIGGLDDQTNFVYPSVAIITSVGFDHQNLLGNSLLEIAEKKAGIIKDNIPVVIGPSANLEPIRAEAEKKGALLSIMEEKSTRDAEINAIVLRVAEILHLKKYKFLTNPSFRFEIVKERFVFDLAHNECSLKNLLKKIALIKGSRKVYCIVSMGRDKNLQSCISLIKKSCSRVYLFHPEKGRLAPRSALAQYAPKALLFNSVSEALLHAMQEDHLVLCCGSAYFMSEAKDFVLQQKLPGSPCHLDKQSLMYNNR